MRSLISFFASSTVASATVPARTKSAALALGLLAWGAVAGVPASTPSRAGHLSIGWGSADLTPPQPVALCGQFELRLSKGVKNPLTATALALEARDESGVLSQAVLVSVDVVCIRRADLERVRALIKTRVPDLEAAKVILATTHTHTAPVLVDAREENPQPQDLQATFVYRVPKEGVMQPRDYAELFTARVADAVVAAWQTRKAGGVSWALSYAVVGHNRRSHYADGRSRLYGPVNEPDFDSFESTIDPGMELLFTWDPAHKLTGVVVNLACPAQEEETASQVSADFWHEARRALRQRHGDGLFILPLCGAAGDQSPHPLYRKGAEATARRRQGHITPCQEIGQRIASAVNAGFDLAKADLHFLTPFAHQTRMVPLPVRQVTPREYEEASRNAQALEAKGPETLASPDYIRWRIAKNIVARYQTQAAHLVCEAEVHTLRLGDIAITTNPFELYVDFGLRLKGRSPAEQTFVVQLACDYLGYLPTERAVKGGHYSAEISSNLAGPEAGRSLVDHTVKLINEVFHVSQ